MEDSEILALLNKRDETGAAALLEKYGGLCRSLISRLLKDERDIEEALNSVMMRLWSSIPPAEPKNLMACVAQGEKEKPPLGGCELRFILRIPMGSLRY